MFSRLPRIETAVLAVWIAAAAAVWGFLGIADEMHEGELDAYDRAVISALRVAGDPHKAIGPHWLVESMRDVTALGGITLLVLVMAMSVIALLAYRHRLEALVLTGSVVLAQISSGLFKNFYERVRPTFAVYGDLPTSMSFPSGHSTTATATYFLLAVIVASLDPARPVKVLAFTVAALLALMIGFSRVFLGVHWPSDVIAGWCLGAAWAFAAAVLLRILKARGYSVRRTST
ncbi:phosphatase PAP2 family protein [Rhizomicrobium electricum]|uniref:Phosphatase PAP2 family protein n=1 Tax=Rhizomicrobium electricum TaxID=480070 RepID=A0ABN1EDR9_9PROT|nr:phosphatase PAP2 family protein [Rhizomicrobium electricum]NIJ48714.1 undecaprenyl-diphosphatase [Rhizomicrobium electricum]